MTSVNKNLYTSYGSEGASNAEGKIPEKKPEIKQGDQAVNTGNNPLQENDTSNINTNNIKNSEHPVTIVEFPDHGTQTGKSGVAGLYGKEEYTPEEAEIADFISKINDETFEAILKSFDQMLENARRMMEEHQKILREKIIPQEEALKKETIKDDIQKEIIQGSGIKQNQ